MEGGCESPSASARPAWIPTRTRSSWSTRDGREYVFSLKEGVIFHHGKELDSGDVKYSIERVMNPATRSPRAFAFRWLDFVQATDKVDADRIGLHGTSMGTYWGPLIVLEDPRVKALSTYASCQYDKDHIFNETSPNFRLRFMWMVGNLGDEEFDRMAARMTLEGRESKITCPHIVFHGEFDHLTNTEEVYRYFDNLASEIKELRIYENEFHGISRFVDEVATMSCGTG